MKRSFSSLSLVITSGLLFAACSSASDTGQPSTSKVDDAQFTAAEATTPPEVTVRAARVVGATDLAGLAATPAVAPAFTHPPEFYDDLRDEMEQIATRPLAATGTPPTTPPTVTPKNIAPTSQALAGFPGLSVVESDTATKGNGVTPPDQALCEGNGFVIEAVNDVLDVYDILGQQVNAPVSLESFFKFPADPDPQHGSFSSDPKCFFDQGSGRFFATVLRITFAPDSTGTGSVEGSKLDIATSMTGDPRGGWNVFEINADDDGTNGSPNHPHCPCLGDQPLLGVDANGVYVATNEFGNDPTFPGFNGAQVYAIDKKALLAGKAANVVQFSSLVLANSIGYSIQPATSPSGLIDRANGGTQYFLSSLDPNGTVDNRIALWTLSNTSSLASATPNLHLEHAVLASETYGQPPPATQKPGPTPMRDCLAAGTCTAYPGVKTTNTLQQLDSGDDRMMQVVYANGRLWGALNSIAQIGVQQHTASAWFSVEVRHLASGQVGGRVASQGYVGLANDDVLYPSITLTDDGIGAIAFSITGPDYWPSAAFARFDAKKGPSDIEVAGAGAAPLDDFSGYARKAGRRQGPARFGDYSAALVDGTTLWMSNEWVPVSCTTLPCAGRDTKTNWGTYFSRIDLADTIDP
jgi:hypothetical protein